jgi:hypothetical protein
MLSTDVVFGIAPKGETNMGIRLSQDEGSHYLQRIANNAIVVNLHEAVSTHDVAACFGR